MLTLANRTVQMASAIDNKTQRGISGFCLSHSTGAREAEATGRTDIIQCSPGTIHERKICFAENPQNKCVAWATNVVKRSQHHDVVED